MKQSIIIKDNYMISYPCCDVCEKSDILPYTVSTTRVAHLSSAPPTPNRHKYWLTLSTTSSKFKVISAEWENLSSDSPDTERTVREFVSYKT